MRKWVLAVVAALAVGQAEAAQMQMQFAANLDGSPNNLSVDLRFDTSLGYTVDYPIGFWRQGGIGQPNSPEWAPPDFPSVPPVTAIGFVADDLSKTFKPNSYAGFYATPICIDLEMVICPQSYGFQAELSRWVDDGLGGYEVYDFIEVSVQDPSAEGYRFDKPVSLSDFVGRYWITLDWRRADDRPAGPDSIRLEGTFSAGGLFEISPIPLPATAPMLAGAVGLAWIMRRIRPSARP